MNSVIEFSLRKGAHVKGSAKEVGEELWNINKNVFGAADYDTDLTVMDPAKVHDYVKSHKSEYKAVSRQLEWDNKAASRQWRIQQLRVLFSAIDIVVKVTDHTKGKPKVERIRAFVNTVDKSGDRAGAGYQSTVAVLNNKESSKLLIERVLRELENWQARARQYGVVAKLFAPVFKAIRLVQKRAKNYK